MTGGGPYTRLNVIPSRDPAIGLFVGLDVSVRKTIVWVTDVNGKVLNNVEAKPQMIASLLRLLVGQYPRAGLEVRPMPQGLYSGLAAAPQPILCVEMWHIAAALSAQICKSDRTGAQIPAVDGHRYQEQPVG
ncbi:hypothetical protein [Paracoccus sp. Ld10]|uniref:hypothetical protein n=1 Tax=Paracoccus sp. Ld10 TaxID=649158 RepID=UPI003869BD2E